MQLHVSQHFEAGGTLFPGFFHRCKLNTIVSYTHDVPYPLMRQTTDPLIYSEATTCYKYCISRCSATRASEVILHTHGQGYTLIIVTNFPDSTNM